MEQDVFDLAVNWIDAMSRGQDIVDIAFHGGEPLLAGIKWYERNLMVLRQRFAERLCLHIQSNLWLLDDALCTLFKDNDVIVGTSLDGPELVNDQQRGKGSFARTMRGIETALEHGIEVGVICTLTRQSAAHLDQMIAFYAKIGLPLQVHLIVASDGYGTSNGLSLQSEDGGIVLVRLYDYYREHLDELRILTFDSIARSLVAGRAGICTFTDCLGGYFAVAPDGGIFSCNRFCGKREWQLGYVQTCPDLASLAASNAWAILAARQSAARRACVGCAFYAICQGGCSFNALIAGRGPVDPHCEAYLQLFRRIVDSALDELFAEGGYCCLLGLPPANKSGMRSALLRLMYNKEAER